MTFPFNLIHEPVKWPQAACRILAIGQYTKTEEKYIILTSKRKSDKSKRCFPKYAVKSWYCDIECICHDRCLLCQKKMEFRHLWLISYTCEDWTKNIHLSKEKRTFSSISHVFGCGKNVNWPTPHKDHSKGEISCPIDSMVVPRTKASF